MTKEKILEIFEKYSEGYDTNEKIWANDFSNLADELLRLEVENLQKAPIIKSICDAAIMPYCTDFMNNGYCGRCGKEMKQTVL